MDVYKTLAERGQTIGYRAPSGQVIPDDEANADYQAMQQAVADGTAVIEPADPPPLVYTDAGPFSVQLRTTDDVAHEIYRVTMVPKTVHQATATIIGVDATSFATKAMEGRFVHRRGGAGAGAVQVGIAVLSDIHDTAAASWQPNALPSGNDIVFTVKGAAGRTIDWTLSGAAFVYAPEGVTV